MTSDEYARLKHIVAGALAQPDANRAAYVSAQCGPDSTIRAEAESLLAAAVRAASLYEDPTLLIAGRGVTLEALEHLEAEFEGTDRYEVRRRIGAGGMGIVYEVHDRARGQIVALKTLRRWSGDDVYRLKREFRSLADVAHRNLVSLYELVIDGRQCFFTMELVDGVTFVEYVRQGSTSARASRARHALSQLIEGVQELHRRGMLHRDIKPSNVLVTSGGRLVLLDFGLSTGARHEDLVGELAGTPAYLSPEQCAGADVSTASDWYSVGATLYHALAGQPPFCGSPREVIERKMIAAAPHVADVAPDVPSDLSDACMALLERNAALRIAGRDALYRLSLPDARGVGAAIPSEAVFVGREDSLCVLREVFDSTRAGRSASVVVHGSSGIGKSALVQRFIDTLGPDRVLVLRSRCHEHETIPYKALDGVIDSIARHLRTLPPAARADTLPSEADALARLFPVLRSAGIDGGIADEIDPIVLRHKAFAAFHELLGRLARRQPVVMDIDDFHWADADSIKWLTDLLHPPGPASVLTLLSFRSEELEAKPFLRSFVERVDIGVRFSLPLLPLSPPEVDELIGALLPAGSTSTTATHDAIARASGGNPFLIDALARDHALGEGSGPSLRDMLSRRLETLPPESRAFLDVLAVCGRPMLPARVFEACGHLGDERPLIARLRSAHLIRNSRTADRVEMYHDRIRETLVANVTADAARRIHDAMARVLVAHGDDDPEALFEHYRAAGYPAQAAVLAAAAGDKAGAVLAFDLAAAFYREAIALQPDGAASTAWRAALARALENAGRPIEAADAYLEAAQRAHGDDRIEWQRKAGELLLIGGRIDQGLRVIEGVLRSVGVPLARGQATAVTSLVLRRVGLRWRGLEFTPRPESQTAHDDLFRIDACWSIIVGLAMVDPIRAADFNVRQLLWALAVGDPYRVARALALEGGFSVLIPVAAARSSDDLYRRAEALAGSAGQHYIKALTSVWAGIGAFLTGRWSDATDRCGHAVTLLRDHCTGVTWELNLAQNFFLFSLLYRGELREAASLWRELIRSARERGNFYMELELTTRLSLLWLAADRPLDAEREAAEAVGRWSQRGFERPQYLQLLTLVQIRLYLGRTREAWELLNRDRQQLRRPLFRRVQHTRVEAANWRARCALALAAEGSDARRLQADAAEQAQRIARELMQWSNPFATLIRATVAYQQGDRREAIDGLTAAADGFSSADMHMHAAACRSRLGTVTGGERGAALRTDADRFLVQQDVRNPAALLRVIAPGFPD